MDQETAQTIATIMGSCGGGAMLLGVGRAIWKQWTGRAAREKSRNTDLLTRADLAETKADDEARKRRLIQEYASRLRRLLIENGIEPDEWPVDATTQQQPPAVKRRGRNARDQIGAAE